jgi:hypothetical protein
MEKTLFFLRNTLIITLIIFTIIFAYRKLLQLLNRGNVNSKPYAKLHYFPGKPQQGIVSIAFSLPEDDNISLAILNSDKSIALGIYDNQPVSKGEHAVDIDTNKLENKEYELIFTSESQKIISKFVVNNG